MIHRNFTVSCALSSPRELGENRVDVFEHDGAVIVVVADGAGGLAGGVRAAEMLVELVREAAASPAFDPLQAEKWAELLARADILLEADRDAGETTSVVLAVAEGLVAGASCGDSGAWVVQADGRIDVTADRTAARQLRLGPDQPRFRTEAQRSRGESARLPQEHRGPQRDRGYPRDCPRRREGEDRRKTRGRRFAPIIIALSDRSR